MPKFTDLTQEQKERIHEALFEQSLTVSQVARELSIPYGTLYKWYYSGKCRILNDEEEYLNSEEGLAQLQREQEEEESKHQ